MSGRQYHFALGVVLVESCVTLGILLTWFISYFITRQLETDFGIPPEALIWMRVVLGLLIIEQAVLTVLLARAVSRKHGFWLQIWIIAQFVHFVLTLVTIILTTMGWMGVDLGWSFNILNGVSLIYRLAILKLISDFKESLPEDPDDITCRNTDKESKKNGVPVPIPKKKSVDNVSIRSGSRIISHV